MVTRATHAELIDLARCDDADALTRLYETYAPALRAYLAAVLRDRHEAEDAAHQVFLKARRALGAYADTGDGTFESWLFRIARNHAIDEHRRRRRVDLLDPLELRRLCERAEAPPAERLSQWISQPEVRAVVDELPRRQRKVITLRYLFGCSHAESARVLGTTEASVRQSHYRALSFIARRLDGVGVRPVEARQEHRMRRLPWRARTLAEGFTLLRG